MANGSVIRLNEEQNKGPQHYQNKLNAERMELNTCRNVEFHLNGPCDQLW